MIGMTHPTTPLETEGRGRFFVSLQPVIDSSDVKLRK
jgi:hypothetical protein